MNDPPNGPRPVCGFRKAQAGKLVRFVFYPSQASDMACKLKSRQTGRNEGPIQTNRLVNKEQAGRCAHRQDIQYLQYI
jgi:hypothetical protein